MTKPHQSVEQFYDEVYKLNPTLTDFNRFCRDYWPDRIVDELKFKQSKTAYGDAVISPVFSVYWENLDYINQVPTSIIKYHIVFAIIPDYSGSEYYASRFYGNFFVFPLNKLKFTRCTNGKCLRSTMKTNNSWCRKCYGEPYIDKMISDFMYDTMEFKNMPRESIIYIEKTVTPINETTLDKAKTLIQRDQSRFLELQAKIDNHGSEIKKWVEASFTELANNKKIMDEMLSARGGNSMESFKARVNVLEKRIATIAIEKERAKIQEECAKIEEQRANLDSKLAELDGKMKELDK